LTLIGEILGVLLGGVLKVTVLLYEQSRSAEELLRVKYKKYWKLMKDNVKLLMIGYKDYVKCLDEKITSLDDSIYAPSYMAPLKTKHKDILGGLVGLIIAMEVGDMEEYEKKLKPLGYFEDETMKYIYGEGATVHSDPASYLKLLSEVFTPTVTWMDDRLNEYSSQIFEGFMQEGIEDALDRLRNQIRF
jgi:hypothetical protein